MRRGLLLAGGNARRLAPTTIATNKHLLPIYDKPLIYYSLSSLMLAGCRQIAVVAKRQDHESLRNLLRDGSHLGLSISFIAQDEPRGIADALKLAKGFIAGGPSVVALGDNILHGPTLGLRLADMWATEGATILAQEVAEPERYGVVQLDAWGAPLAIAEKPEVPLSSLAVAGLYFFDGNAACFAGDVTPSPRGEVEVTDVLDRYMSRGMLKVVVLPRGTYWMDAGTVDAARDAAEYVRSIQRRTGGLVSSPEEIAWRRSWISTEQLHALASEMHDSPYGRHLLGLS